jgi:hypothetical protein
LIVEINGELKVIIPLDCEVLLIKLEDFSEVVEIGLNP